MGVRSKTLVVVLLVGVVIGVFTLQSKNKNLFQGKIEKIDSEAVETATDNPEATAENAKPDLSADLVIVAPEKEGGDLSAKVTISNNGPGAIKGDKPFKYTVYLNGAEVFSNTDSYTTMNAGDSFSFNYPISKAVYNYPDEGTAKVVIDGDDAIDESEEGNNSSEVDYFLNEVAR